MKTTVIVPTYNRPKALKLCLLSLADAHFANGSKDKAIEFGEKALKSTEIKGFKDFIEKKLKTYKGEKEEKKDAKPKDDK